MVSGAIDSAGGWEGQQAPTQTDIQRLMSDPSPPNIKSFDEQFGDGAAEKILSEQGGGGEESSPREPPADEAEGPEDKAASDY
jgi:hypothetical protein